MSPCTVDGDKPYRVQRYRPRIEGLFARIERWTNQADAADTSGAPSPRTTSPPGTARPPRAASPIPPIPPASSSWLICESYDDKGNVIVYGYNGRLAGRRVLPGPRAQPQRNDTTRARPTATSSASATAITHRIYPALETTNRWPAPPGATELDGSDWFFEVVFDYGEHDLNIADAERRGQMALPQRSVLLVSCRLRSAHLSPVPARADVPSFPGRARMSAPTAWCARPTSPIRTKQRPRRRAIRIFSFLLSVTQSGYQAASRRRLSSGNRCRRWSSTYSEPTIDETFAKSTPRASRTCPTAWTAALPMGGSRRRRPVRHPDRAGRGLVLQAQPEPDQYASNGTDEHTVVARFAPLERWRSKPSLQPRRRTAAVPGSGRRRPARSWSSSTARRPGFYERTEDEGWEPSCLSRRCPILTGTIPISSSSISPATATPTS